MRLVEIVEVDHQVPFWGRVEPEVAQVGIAADDRVDSGGG
jgi:hypothetical protein